MYFVNLIFKELKLIFPAVIRIIYYTESDLAYSDAIVNASDWQRLLIQGFLNGGNLVPEWHKDIWHFDSHLSLEIEPVNFILQRFVFY